MAIDQKQNPSSLKIKMDKKIKANCGKCGSKFIYPLSQVPLHISAFSQKLLCPNCCKEEFYWDDLRCSHCSEKFVCKMGFNLFMSKKIQEKKGI